MFDYLIVGAGLFGAVCARELADAGRSVKVVERRGVVGGNCHDELKDGIRVSTYGGHIFHTNSRRVWQYVNRFAEFQQYEHRVKARYGETVYSFPPNLMTLQQMGVTSKAETERRITEMFFRGYSEKQWGRPLEDIPAHIIKRIPIRENWDDRYFTDEFQGLPVDGYTNLIGRMLDGIPVEFSVDYLADRPYWDLQAERVIYTGALDALYGCDLGALEYRSLTFQTTRYDTGDWQGCPAMNYTAREVPFTRTTEWRHLWRTPKTGYTFVTHEYPAASGEPFYPVGDAASLALHAQYVKRAQAEGVVVGGRLGSYQYLNMDQTIAAAMQTAKGLAHG